jgi:hypothetical protein
MDNNPRRVIRLTFIPSRSVVYLFCYMKQRKTTIEATEKKVKGFVERIKDMKDSFTNFIDNQD